MLAQSNYQSATTGLSGCNVSKKNPVASGITSDPTSPSPKVESTEFSHQSNDSSALTPKHYAELKASCIDDAIIERYFFSTEGDEAQQYLIEDAAGKLSGHSSQYATAPVRKLQQQSDHVKDGAWGCHANGQLKPDSSRIKWEKLSDGLWVKVRDESRPDGLARIKYEIIREKPYRGIHVNVMQPVAQRSAIHVITEGAKKAGSTASIGYPSIGLPGVEMGLTAKDDHGNRVLIPVLQAMAERGDMAVIGYDCDLKESTRNNISWAKSKLAAEYEAQGGVAFILPEWPTEYGKGIDDVMATQGAGYVHSLIAAAIPFKQWRTARMTQQLRTSKPEYYGLTCDRTIIHQRYIDYTLSAPGTLLAISSPMETGKTVTGGKFKDAFFQRHPDGLFEVQGYRNGLGQQTASKWGIDHISDLETIGANVSQLLIDDALALAYCLDSLSRRAKAIRNAIDDGRTVCIFLDEADAVLKHITGGGTLGKRQADIWVLWCDVLRAVIAGGGYIVLAEANLTQVVVDAIAEISGGKVEAIENTYQPHAGRKVIDYSALNAKGKHADQLLAKACFSHILHLADDGPVFVAADSQGFAERVEAGLLAIGLKVLRIDGTTIERPETRAFMQNPDGYIAEHRPDVVIVTTTAESGVSISDGYFENVVLYGSHLEDRALAQLSGRVRGEAPLHLFVKRRVHSIGDDPDSFSVDGILKEWHQNAFDSGAAAGVRQHFDPELLAAAGQRTQSTHAERLHRLKAHYQARANISKFSLHYGLIGILEHAGCELSTDSLQPSTFDKAEKEVFEMARDAVRLKAAGHYVDAPLGKSVAWALRVNGAASSKHLDKVEAAKVLMEDAYPGLPLNDLEFVLEEVIGCRGDRIRSHTFSWLAQHPKIAKLIDLQSWKTQLEQKFIIMSSLKRESAKAELIAQSALMKITELETYEESTPLVVAVAQWARDRRKLLYRMFRIQCKDEYTNIAIVNKLVRKIGYKAFSCNRLGSSDDRRQIWKAEPMPHQAEVWAALERKWCGELQDETVGVEQPSPSVSLACVKEKDHRQTGDIETLPPIEREGAVVQSPVLTPEVRDKVMCPHSKVSK